MFLPGGMAVGLVTNTGLFALANVPPADPAKVYIKQCWSTMGPMSNMKRMLPAPQGRAYQFKRKVCHLTIVVSDERQAKGAKA